MRIGFIGLGNMGGPMAANLVKAGHDVAVFDMASAAVEKAVAAGAHSRGSASDAAREQDAVVTMLPAGQHVRQVYLGDSGILKTAKAG
ncbi:MAG: NAD(P)-binding domain-containing protein, partial [Alphaproteobacteria bacterium]|nr:NAD(P)-binding domain-containing protein [Alphaproteobacteria bacterium]